jgi:homogentisate 1,2-dioxygenase
MRLGDLPHKRHTQFRQQDGSLYAEQLFSTEGFSSNYSLLYHCHPPTEILSVGQGKDIRPKRAADQTLKPRS